MTSRELKSFLWRTSLLVNKNRYRQGRVAVLGQPFQYVDWPSFVHQYHDIFVRHVYRLPDPDKAHVIFDCGVNVGASMVYFLSTYPNAVVKGWEADSGICEVAARNLRFFNTGRYKLESKAVWVSNDGVSFSRDKADAGSTVLQSSAICTVPSIRLKEELALCEKIDFLKIDIEGAEFAVLTDSESELHRVRNMFVEVHLNDGLLQEFTKLMQLLEHSGFNLRIEAVGSLGRSPMIGVSRQEGFDSQMNIYCIRS